MDQSIDGFEASQDHFLLLDTMVLFSLHVCPKTMQIESRRPNRLITAAHWQKTNGGSSCVVMEGWPSLSGLKGWRTNQSQVSCFELGGVLSRGLRDVSRGGAGYSK